MIPSQEYYYGFWNLSHQEYRSGLTILGFICFYTGQGAQIISLTLLYIVYSILPVMTIYTAEFNTTELVAQTLLHAFGVMIIMCLLAMILFYI